jgi:hypothetical protein
LVQWDEAWKLSDMFSPFVNHSSLQYLDLQLHCVNGGTTSLSENLLPNPEHVFPPSALRHLKIHRIHGNDDYTVQVAMRLWPLIVTLVVASYFDFFHGSNLTTLFLWSLPHYSCNTSEPIFLDRLLEYMPAIETLTILYIES